MPLPSKPPVAFAHSIKGSPEEKWERLPVHLTNVGDLTGRNAAKFGFGSLGRVLGGLHDFGKFKNAFQRYLRDPKVTGKGHSAAGALYAWRHFGDVFGPILAHAIAGHHSGLGDGLLGKDGRLERAANELDLALAGFAALPSGFDLPSPPEDAGDLEVDGDSATGFQIAFLIRFLFSCLVDADRICTEGYYAGEENLKVERGPRATIVDLVASFLAWMAAEERKRTERGDERKEVNLRRREILDSVRAFAERDRGVFTLTVPTGGGKTLSSMDFALRHAAHHGLDRVIVIIPFTGARIETSSGVTPKGGLSVAPSRERGSKHTDADGTVIGGQSLPHGSADRNFR